MGPPDTLKLAPGVRIKVKAMRAEWGREEGGTLLCRASQVQAEFFPCITGRGLSNQHKANASSRVDSHRRP